MIGSLEVLRDLVKTEVDLTELIDRLQLGKKEMSRGLNIYNLNSGKHKKPTYILPINLIPKIMEKFSASQAHVDKVTEMYQEIHNKSSLLNHSNPKSVIAGLVFYYCRSIGRNIPCKKFSTIVKLSYITINRIARNISDIRGTKFEISLADIPEENNTNTVTATPATNDTSTTNVANTTSTT